MWAVRCPLEERVYRGAGRSRRRARGDGVLVWSAVALPCLCGGSFLGLFSRERGRSPSFFSSVSRSLHRLCVRNVVFVYEQHTNMVVTTT